MLSFFFGKFFWRLPLLFLRFFQSSTVLAFLREGFLVTSSASGVGGLSWNFSLKNSRTPFMTIVKGEMLRVFFCWFFGSFPGAASRQRNFGHIRSLDFSVFCWH